MKTIDLEGTVMQPHTSSSDIEWGTPNHPRNQIAVFIVVVVHVVVIIIVLFLFLFS